VERTRPQGFTVRVFFQPLRGRVELRRILEADGWTLEAGWDDTLLAEHPAVADEAAARSRLHHLGLLTSGRLRIEFLRAVRPPRRARQEAPCSTGSGKEANEPWASGAMPDENMLIR
jgi:hypothetical protein